ncbi:MAG: hypothetical protein IH784_09960 [Bacteroidetes bacterium]|nr:hypothetical protein [Bacteroidota bacterium]
MKTYLKCILLFLTLTILLIVSCSEEAPVNLTSTPIAKAGADQLVEIYDIVYLDGSLSTNSENVEYIWSFNYKPPGSITVLSDSSASNPILSPDLPGFYNVQLIIKDKEMYSEPDFVTIQAIDAEPENYFPQKVGNKWKYKVTDSTGTVKDTITVEIVGTTTLQNGEPASIWVYSDFGTIYLNGYIDTLYLVTRVDTLIYYQIYQNDLLPFLGYIVPFQVGDSWGEMWVTSTVNVLEYNSITIDIGTFYGAYQMEHLILWAYGSWSYNWIVPRVGLVKMDLTRCHPDPVDRPICTVEYWELIWYNSVE